MKKTLIKTLLLSLTLFAFACGGDDDNNQNNPNNANNSNNDNNDNNDNNVNNVNNSNNANNGGAFAFRTDDASAYTRVDRMGMPAVSTALLTDKLGYNDADPADDANGDFVTDIVANLTGLHTALDDDLMGANLMPCDMADTDNDGLPDCVGQPVFAGGPSVASLILPDTLKIDPAGASGFPNGRRLADPVMDVTLAVVLLDMTVHAPDVLAGLPLNPAANDVDGGSFPTTFPYLHPANVQ